MVPLDFEPNLEDEECIDEMVGKIFQLQSIM